MLPLMVLMTDVKKSLAIPNSVTGSVADTIPYLIQEPAGGCQECTLLLRLCCICVLSGTATTLLVVLLSHVAYAHMNEGSRKICGHFLPHKPRVSIITIKPRMSVYTPFIGLDKNTFKSCYEMRSRSPPTIHTPRHDEHSEVLIQSKADADAEQGWCYFSSCSV